LITVCTLSSAGEWHAPILRMSETSLASPDYDAVR
jgi:hypothetical protein